MAKKYTKSILKNAIAVKALGINYDELDEYSRLTIDDEYQHLYDMARSISNNSKNKTQ